MAIRNQKKRDEKIYAKEDDIIRQAGMVAAQMTTLTNELEKFVAFMFSHPENYDPEDVATVTTLFEARRVEMDALMVRINAIGQIAPDTVRPEDIPANGAAFMLATSYDDAAYSATFD